MTNDKTHDDILNENFEEGDFDFNESDYIEEALDDPMLDDFDFDLNINVTGFSFKVNGQPTIKVSGKKLNGQASGALKRAKRGETVQIFDIKANIAGNSGYKLKKISPICIELTN